MTSPPAVPADRVAGWRLVDERVETPFDIRLVTVTAHTSVYDDPDLAAAIRDQTATDGPGRFFLASHVVLQPQPPSSDALRRLVTDRVARDFARQLRERGFTSVEQRSRRSFSVAGSDARLVAYDGRCTLGSLTLDVRAWLAVWQVDGDFLLAGGAYPTSVRSSDDETASEVIAALLRPQAFRDELFELIRSVERE
jgi:hypothetical protein